jgi:hypothetical protein
MMARNASVGDALIFMTKAVLGFLLVVALGAAALAWAIFNQDARREAARLSAALRTEQALSQKAVEQVGIHEMTIASLGSKLDACLAGVSQ